MKYIASLLFFLSVAAFAQQNKNVDFKAANAYLTFDVPQKKVMGKVAYTFELLNKKTDTIYIDARNMKFSNVTINGKKAGWTASASALKLYKGFKKGKNSVEFSYEAQPRQTLYFVSDGAGVQIWTQGQGKYTSHWLPSFDNVNEKVIFNISASFDKGYTVLANGVLKNKTAEGSIQKWAYQMEKPMSSYLVMIAIGKFRQWNMVSRSGTPLEQYLREEDSLKLAYTYRYSWEMFDFLEEEIGVKYPWQVYRQVPVLDFLYAGMENTTATIFAQDFVVDSIGFNDRTYVNVNAHELAHQWFGDLVTAKSGRHHWLQEGFATYYALLAEQRIYGDDHFYYEMYKMAERLQIASETDTIPVLNESASSLSFYQKGAWALHVLREGVGHDKFRTAVKIYLEKYVYSNVDTDEFLAEINKVSDYDTAAWKRRWLESGTFEVQEAMDLLRRQSDFIQLYFEVGSLQEIPFAEKKQTFMDLLRSNAFYAAKEEAIFQTAEVPFNDKAEFIREAMQSKNILLRQAVARTVTKIPVEFAEEYKTLLYDESYITREIALNVLCKNFPERQAEFLDIAVGWVGFNDKNLRILWLTLAYKADGYRAAEKEKFYAELQAYAGPGYESTVRQNALANLLYLGKPDPVVLQNLVNATSHHKWQFSKFGRDNIRKLLKKEGYRSQFQSLLPQLPEAERKRLEGIMAE